MSDPIEITVTQKHVDEGERQNCHRCPVALATLESHDWCARAGRLGDQVDVWADGCHIKVRIHKPSSTFRDHWFSFRTPMLVAHFMDDVDAGRNVRPFAFTIPPEEIHNRAS